MTIASGTRRASGGRHGVRSPSPPHDLDAEEAVLGAMLLSAGAAAAASEWVGAADFYAPKHQAVFAAIESVTARGEPADPVTVRDELRRAGQLDIIGDPALLVTLQIGAPGTTNAAHYAKIVSDHATRRRLAAAAGDIATTAFEPGDVAEMVSNAESLLLAVADPRFAGTRVSGAELAGRVEVSTAEMAARPGAMLGVPTGFADIDRVLRGLRSDQLVVVGGRPSIGKTAFVLQLALHAAVVERIPTAVFSLEMGVEELGYRAASILSGVSTETVETGSMSLDDAGRWQQALDTLRAAPLVVEDVAPLTVGGLRSRARRLALRDDIGLVAVDYLQLISPGRSTGDRQVDVSAIAQGLKMVARELHLPLVVPAQLSRAVELRQDKRPVLSDLRESGQIEAAADVVLLLYRDDYYNPTSESRGVAEVAVAKNRNGRSGVRVDLAWREALASFGSLAKRDIL